MKAETQDGDNKEKSPDPDELIGLRNRKATVAGTKERDNRRREARWLMLSLSESK